MGERAKYRGNGRRRKRMRQRIGGDRPREKETKGKSTDGIRPVSRIRFR